MKIAFVNPPPIGRRGACVEAEDCCWGIGPLVLPAMLLACASEAKRAGQHVKFIDLAIDGQADLSKYDLVVHSLAWQWYKPVNEAMEKLCGGVPRIVLAVPPGYADVYRIYAPYVIHSEPERAMMMLPSSLSWLDAWYGQYRHAQENAFNDLFSVDYTLVPKHYWKHYKAAVYQVTRGCPYRCKFCVWGGSTVTDTSFKMRPAKQVADDLKQLRELSTAERGTPLPLYLLAAQLTTSRKWIDAFRREMEDDPYPFQSNVNLFDLTEDRIVDLMAAGLVSTSVGLEAVTTPLLKKLGKPYTFEKALDSLLVLQRVGIRFKAHIRYGFGETEADVQESVENVKRMRAAGLKNLLVDFAPIIHYSGTQIRDECDYEIVSLRGGVKRWVMKHPPNWQPFVDELDDWVISIGARK